MCRRCNQLPAHILNALTPQMRAVLDHQLARNNAQHPQTGAADHPTEEAARLEATRAEYRDERTFWNAGGPTMATTQDRHLHSAGVDVPIRIHRPTDAPTLPAMVYFHGGGFSVGDLDTHDRIMRVLAEQSRAAVVGVDYSLAPEARFPQALHECAGVVGHLAADGRRYGIEPSRIAVAGDSAGAALAMGSTLLLRDEPETADHPHGADGARAAFGSIRAVLCYYGSHGLRDSVTGRLYGGFWDGLSRQDRDHIDTLYFTDPADRRSPYVDHLSADLTSKLPPVHVVGAELDPLADDSRALAEVLAHNGQQVDFHLIPGVLHSFLHFGRMLDDATEALTRGAEFARGHL